MRLGAQEVLLGAGTRAREIYGSDVDHASATATATSSTTTTCERYRSAGLRFSGFSRDGLVEMIELPSHPWFVGDAVPPGVHVDAARRPSAVHRLHPRGARASRRAAQLPQRARAARMKLAGFEVGLDRPFFLIAGPCVIESADADAGHRRPAARRSPRASASRSSSRPPTTRPTAPRARASAARASTRA